MPRLIAILAAWGLLIGAIQIYAWRAMLTPAELVQQMEVVCHSTPAGPLLFIGVAALSPLLLVPAALLGGLAGACFGPALGIFYTLIGCNLSALLTYSMGRLSRQEHGSLSRLCTRYAPRLQRRPLLSVIALRLCFLPYDPINFLIGLLRVRLWAFLIGNTLGSLPGVIAIVLAGSALGGLHMGAAPTSLAFICGAIGLVAESIVLVVVLRKRFGREV